MTQYWVSFDPEWIFVYIFFQLTVALLLKEGYLIPLHQRLATMPKAADKDSEKLLWFMVEDIFNADAEGDRSLSLALARARARSLALSLSRALCLALSLCFSSPLLLSHENYGYMASEFIFFVSAPLSYSQMRTTGTWRRSLG